MHTRKVFIGSERLYDHTFDRWLEREITQAILPVNVMVVYGRSGVWYARCHSPTGWRGGKSS